VLSSPPYGISRMVFPPFLEGQTPTLELCQSFHCPPLLISFPFFFLWKSLRCHFSLDPSSPSEFPPTYIFSFCSPSGDHAFFSYPQSSFFFLINPSCRPSTLLPPTGTSQRLHPPPPPFKAILLSAHHKVYLLVLWTQVCPVLYNISLVSVVAQPGCLPSPP